MRLTIAALCCAALLALAGDAPARAPDGWSWSRDDGADGKPGWYLLRGDAQAGWLDAQGVYRPKLGAGKYGPPCAAPVDAPARKGCPCPDCGGCDRCGCPVFGVDQDRLKATAAPAYRVGDRTVSRDEALKALGVPAPLGGEGADPLPDDGQARRIVVVGPEAERKAVADALSAAPEAKGYVVQGYDPTHWHVKGVGYLAGVTITDADGKVLHRQKDLDAAGVVAALGRLRKPDPNYDPAKDPDLRAAPPAPPGLPGVPPPPWYAALAAGLAVAGGVARTTRRA